MMSKAITIRTLGMFCVLIIIFINTNILLISHVNDKIFFVQIDFDKINKRLF